MKLREQTYAILLKIFVFKMFAFLNVNMQTVNHQLVNPSAEFQSTHYLETHENIYEAWTIIVDESHRIRLQFLDFGLDETPQCTDDFLDLFDGPSATSVLIGKWCWNSFAELSPTTYISSSRFFYLRLQINGIGSRRGFKANYTSRTGTVEPNTTTLLTPTALLKTTNTESQEVVTSTVKPSTGNLLRGTTLLKTEKTGMQVAVKSTIDPSVSTFPRTTELSKTRTSGSGSLLGIVTAVVLVVLCLVVLAVLVLKYRIINRTKSSPHHGEDDQPQTLTNMGMYEEVNNRKVYANECTYENSNQTKINMKTNSKITTSSVKQSGIYSKEIVRQTPAKVQDTPDGTYEKPDVNVYSYADVIF